MIEADELRRIARIMEQSDPKPVRVFKSFVNEDQAEFLSKNASKEFWNEMTRLSPKHSIWSIVKRRRLIKKALRPYETRHNQSEE